MRIFALVCALNESTYIEGRILNLRAMLMLREVVFEIHILDNGSVDDTCAIAGRIADLPGVPVTVHKLDPIGKCGALFWAFQNLTADYYLLTDANTVFSKHVLTRFVNHVSLCPKVGLVVGNFRSVKTANQGNRFLNSDKVMPFGLRIKIEMFLGICTGANGACYCVKREAVDSIWFASPVRNDDFVISIFSSSKMPTIFAEDIKAYEVENLVTTQLFHQKYRDALGHHQAILWMLRNTIGLRPRIAILLRLVYWLTPLFLGLMFLALVGWCYMGFIILMLSIVSRGRQIIIRTIAMYTGYVVGVFKSPSVRWTPTR